VKRKRPEVEKGSSRRGFLKGTGLAGVGFPLLAAARLKEPALQSGGAGGKRICRVKGAFIYPPSASLKAAGYWSWPGSSFDPEGRQKKYSAEISAMARRLGMRIEMKPQPLDKAASVDAFIREVKKSSPDGLLLIPFKKGHWGHVIRIVEAVNVPTVVLASLGILLVGHINQLHRREGVYLITSLDDLEAVESGMRMIRTAHKMKNAVIVDLRGDVRGEKKVPHLGTLIRTIPLRTFWEEFARTEETKEVKRLADQYLEGARAVEGPSKVDILDAAKTYFVLKKIVEDEKADAVMMNCLPGLRKPHRHPPPCMGFMSLRDEGIPAGCQSDLNATLTLLLVQELFGKPGFQQNASMDTENNLYFGAHCTCASRLTGLGGPSEPYELMHHAEAGWGCVPRVLWRPGWRVTMAQYRWGETPRMYVYSGSVVRCPPIPETGGCRTNIELALKDVEDVCDVKGMHQIIFHGDHAKELRTFCRLFGIAVES